MSKQTKTFKILTSPSGDYKCQGSRQDDDKSQQNSDHEIKQDRLPFPLKKDQEINQYYAIVSLLHCL